ATKPAPNAPTLCGWASSSWEHLSASRLNLGATSICGVRSFAPANREGRPWVGAYWRELGLCCAEMSGGSARSLGKGSAPPGPVPEGLIRVYSMRFCPFAKRTLLVLKAKGIGHEVININLKNKPEWFFKKNPFGLVPVLENSQGQVIYESAITCEYLDEAYPGKKLLPDDPYEKACQKMVFELFSKVLTNKKTTFFGGSSLSMIDYLIWPWFEWLIALELNEYVDHTPNLKLWMEAMMKDPAVSSLFIDPKAFRGFLDLYLQNNLEAYEFRARRESQSAAVLGVCSGGSKPHGRDCERWSLCRRQESMTDDATRTLGKGSAPPGPVPEGLIRLYSMRFCPYAHRTRLVLRAKGIRHEVININLRNKPEWYFTKHPFGQIPVLENSKGQLIYESVIACEYLDDAYPGRKLYPYDSYERARQKMLLELFYKVPHLTKECLVTLRCGRGCADLKLALRQEFCNLEEVQNGPPSWPDAVEEVMQVPT
ncbi:hypothetical protein E2I00_015905, partial [Balaenoptera physalus]